jgi:hypothetical protein
MKESWWNIIFISLTLGIGVPFVGYFYDHVKGIHETLNEILAELRKTKQQ